MTHSCGNLGEYSGLRDDGGYEVILDRLSIDVYLRDDRASGVDLDERHHTEITTFCDKSEELLHFPRALRRRIPLEIAS